MKKVKEIARNIIIILLILILFKATISFELAKTQYETYEYLVTKNDTLWTIASRIIPEGKNLNIRKVIYDIKEINCLEDSIIYSGQTLMLPIYN